MRLFSRFNRVLAIGKETYIRVWPNPGIGLCLGRRRWALSWWGGFEAFRFHSALLRWQRQRAFLSRVKRPGGKV